MTAVTPLCKELEAGTSMMYYEEEGSNGVHTMCNYAGFTSKRQVEEWVKEQEPDRTVLNKTVCTEKKMKASMAN